MEVEGVEVMVYDFEGNQEVSFLLESFPDKNKTQSMFPFVCVILSEADQSKLIATPCASHVCVHPVIITEHHSSSENNFAK